MHVDTLVRMVEQSEGVLAAWLEGASHVDARRLELHLALDEVHFAPFYARRHEWLAPLRPVYVRDIHHPWPGCLALTRDSALLILALETWGALPALPRREVQVLLDRTGRLHERLRERRPPERVDFALLDRLAADVWLSLWEASLLRARDAAGYARAVITALDAYLAFVAATQGESAEHLGWQGKLARAAGLDDNIVELSIAQVEQRVAELMRSHARRLGEARGWTYPTELEEAVLHR